MITSINLQEGFKLCLPVVGVFILSDLGCTYISKLICFMHLHPPFSFIFCHSLSQNVQIRVVVELAFKGTTAVLSFFLNEVLQLFVLSTLWIPVYFPDQ